MDGYLLSFIVTSVSQGVFAAAVAFCWGRAGILTLGPSLYFGLGAYGVALAARYDFPPSIGALCALACALLVCTLVSLTTIGKPGGILRYAACTMVLSLLAQRLTIRVYDFTGGSNGITLPSLFINGSDFPLSIITTVTPVGVCLLLLLCLVVADWRFRSVLLTLRDTPEGFIRLGRDVTIARTAIVVATTFVIVLAGTLYAPASGIVSPEIFAVSHSMKCLAWVVIGGRRPHTAFAAAVVIQAFELLVGSAFSDWYLLAVAAVVLIASVLHARRERLRSAVTT